MADYSLGTAFGKVVVDYESRGAARAAKDMEVFQKTAQRAGKEMGGWGQKIGLQSEALDRYASISKAHADAQRVAIRFESQLNTLRASGTATIRQMASAESLAYKSRKSLSDMTKVLADSQKGLPKALAGAGSQAAASFSQSFSSKAISAFNNASSKLGSVLLSGITATLQAGALALGVTLAAVVAAAGAGIFKVLQGGLQRLTTIDEARLRLEALGKSTGQITFIMNAAERAVLGTAASLDQAADAASRAVMAGVKFKDLEQYIKNIANAAALSSAPFDVIANIFLEITRRGKVMMDEVNQLSEWGFDIWPALAKSMGVTVQEAQRLADTVGITADQFFKAMGTMGEAAKVMEKSVRGQFAQVQTALNRLGASILAPLFSGFDKQMSPVANGLRWIREEIDKLNTWVKANKNEVVDALSNIGKVGVKSFYALADVISVVISGFTGFMHSLGHVIWWIAHIEEILKLPGWNKGRVKQYKDIGDSIQNIFPANGEVNLKKFLPPLDSVLDGIDDLANKAKNAAPAVEEVGDATDNAASQITTFDKVLEKLGINLDSVSSGLTGTDEEFQKLLKTLKDKKASQELITIIQHLRREWLNGGRDAHNLAQAIDQLGDSEVDAATKGEALYKSLVKLGILKNTDSQTSQWNESIQELLSYENNWVDHNSRVGDSLIGLDGTIQSNTKNGAKLNEMVGQLAQNMLSLMASGEVTPTEAFEKASAALHILGRDVGLSEEAIDKMVRDYLGDPHYFEVIFKATGDDFLSNVLKNLTTQLEASKKSGKNEFQIDVGTNLTTEQQNAIKEQMDNLGLQIQEYNPETGTLKLKIPEGVDITATQNALEAVLNSRPPQITAEIQAEENAAQKLIDQVTGGNPLKIPAVLEITGAETKPGEPKPGEQPQKPQSFNEGKPFPEVEGPPINTPRMGPGPAIEPGTEPSPTTNTPAPGTNIWDWFKKNFIDPLGRINISLTSAIQQTIMQPLEDAEDKAILAGRNLSEGFAQGINDNQGRVVLAARRLAEAAADYLPTSPAKVGPLSGKGSPFNRGRNLSMGFAEGIAVETSSAKQSAYDLAYGTGNVMDDAFIKMINDWNELSGLGQSILSLVSSIFDIFQNIIQVAQTASGGRLFPKTYVKDAKAAAEAERKRRREAEIGPATIRGTKPNTNVGALQYTGKDAELAKELKKHGFSDSQIIGLVELNRVETGNWSHPESIMGFTNQQTGPGIAAHVAGFKEMWDRRQRTGAVGPPAGVVNGQVIDPKAYADWLLKLEGYSATQDWQGNQYAPGQFMSPEEYSKRVSDAYNNQRLPTISGPKLPGKGTTYTKAEAERLGLTPLYTPGEYPVGKTGNLPQWVYDLAGAFNLQVGSSVSRSGAGSLHAAGLAFDFSGAKKDMERFAQWIIDNALSETVQMIYQGNKPYEVAGGELAPGYYAEDLGAHGGHVHLALTNPVSVDGDLNVTGPGQEPPALAQDDHANKALDNIDQNTSDTASNLDDLSDLGPLDEGIQKLAENDPQLQDLIKYNRGSLDLTDEQLIPTLQHIDDLIAEQNSINTEASRANVTELEDIRSQAMERGGLVEGPDVVGAIGEIGGAVGSLVGDVFELIDANIKGIASTKEITGTLAKGLANTEDIYGMIESSQAFLEIAEKIAGTVADSLTLAAGIVGLVADFIGPTQAYSVTGGEMGGGGVAPGAATKGALEATASALQLAAMIANIVESAIAAINAGIDIAQQAYRIGTKYLGRILTEWLGFGGYQGQIQFLLDTVTGQLMAYTAENPEMKTTFNTLGRAFGIGPVGGWPERERPVNNLYIYQGPGQDPRDTMNDAMFAIKSADVGVFGYG